MSDTNRDRLTELEDASCSDLPYSTVDGVSRDLLDWAADEIKRLADELDHWRKRAVFAEQFIPHTSDEPTAPQ